MGKTVEFARPDGTFAPGYLSAPASEGDAPGVVLFGEWWGLTEHIKETADRLAGAGFRVLVPDLYRGSVADTREEAGHLMEGLDFSDAVSQDARGAAAYLRHVGARRVGVMGFCMGGALAMLTAMHDPDFDSAVIFYGYPPPEAGDPSTIGIPIMGHWAHRDEFFDIARVDALEEALAAKGVPFEFHRYDAKHAFYNPGGLGNYHREHAEAAWARSVEFFKRTLA
ncbi:MAG: dienelactone hydrolase family protein [Candidatus Tumulicola sp.]